MSKPAYLKEGSPARLFPIEKKIERRTLSTFLACLIAVPEYRNRLLKTVGAGTGSRDEFSAYTEIVFRKSSSKKDERPDGLIVVSNKRGVEQWKALIEAKTEKRELTKGQIQQYIEIANAQNIDMIITISNQFTAAPEHHPCALSKRERKGINLYHWSWRFLRTQALLLIGDQDFDIEKNKNYKYLIGEWIEFLKHDVSGLLEFKLMNKGWKELVRRASTRDKLKRDSKDVIDAVSSWYQELQDLALAMSGQFNVPVRVYINRSHKNDVKKRLDEGIDRLCKKKVLEGRLRISNAAPDLYIVSKLESWSISISMGLKAPDNIKRTPTRINWLLKQLRHLEGKRVKGFNTKDLSIEAFWGTGKKTTEQKLNDLFRGDFEGLIERNQQSKLTWFEILLVKRLENKFSSRSKFIEEIENSAIAFYENIGEYLQPYTPPAPRIKKGAEGEDDEESDDSSEK